MKWISNIKIGTRLLGGFIMIAIIATCIGLFGVYNINQISNNDSDLYEKMTEPLGTLVDITNHYQEMRIDMRETLLASDAAGAQEYMDKFQEESAGFDEAINVFSQTLVTTDGKTIVQNVQTLKDSYAKTSTEAMQLIIDGKKADALTLLKSEGSKTASDLDSAIQNMVDIKVKVAKETAATNNKIADTSVKTTVIIIVIGILIAIALGVIISRSISKPIKKLMGVANEIASGNLDVNVTLNSKDEIGILANAFRKMTDKLNDVMSNISIASEQVAAGARQVSDSSIALSQGATEQASSIEELTASVEQISSQTRQNATHADEANHLSLSAKEDAARGNMQMKEMEKAMEEINESSTNISRIIKVIDEIAFQTNILALNAAVEAARAGQHGKGFAVVAEEVRNLAARSANAAKETTDMIEGSIQKVAIGTNIATETATALNKIVEGVEKVTHIVGGIAVASNEQAQGIEQINQGLMQVSTVVQTNSVTSEESATASEELSSQSELLKDQVAQFKLRNTSYTVPAYESYKDISSEKTDRSDNISNTKDSASSKDNSYKKPTKIILSDHDFGKY